MPNINTLQTITQTSSGTFVIASDNGFARRISVGLLTNSINSQVGSNQPLYTTSSVTFNSILLTDNSSPSINKLQHGFSTFYNSSTGGSIQDREPIGILKFNGYDGVNPPSDSTFPSFVLTSFATEPFSGISGLTTNAGVGWLIAAQPPGTQVGARTRQRMILGEWVHPVETPTGILPPVAVLRFGSGIDGSLPTLVSSSGTNMQPGYGKTNVEFMNSSIRIFGVTGSDPTPENDTVTSTNFISFVSSRTSAVTPRRTAIKNNDSLGGLLFSGSYIDETTATVSFSQVSAAGILVNAISDFSTSTHAANLVFYTSNISGNQNRTKLLLSETENTYVSDKHTFNNVNQDNILDVSSTATTLFNGTFAFHSTGTMVFPDNSVQTTAYPGTFPRAVAVPASSGSAGNVGDVAWDAAYVYICVAPNTWRRSVATGF